MRQSSFGARVQQHPTHRSFPSRKVTNILEENLPMKLSLLLIVTFCQHYISSTLKSGFKQRGFKNTGAQWSPTRLTLATESQTGKLYLEVPFSDKDNVKALGARWDPQARKWFVSASGPIEQFRSWMTAEQFAAVDVADSEGPTSGSNNEISSFPAIQPTPAMSDNQNEKLYLDVPFDDKESVKALGARWDPQARKWFAWASGPTEPFRAWLGTNISPSAPATRNAAPSDPSLTTATEGSIYLKVPFGENQLAKSLGARFDSIKKSWYVPTALKGRVKEFRQWIPTYLETTFDESQIVKSMGALWDPSVKKWYVPTQISLEGFEPWLPVESQNWTENVKKNDDPVVTNDFDFDAQSLISTPAFVHSPQLTQRPTTARSRSSEDNILFLDVQTTGIPTKISYDEYYDITDSSKYDSARIVQMSCMLCKRATLAEVARFDAIFRADDFSISPVSAALHKIDQQRSMEEGVSFVDAIQQQVGPLLQRAHTVVAHQASFDVHVLQAELYRYGLVEALSDLNALEVYCTMHKTKHLVGAMGKHGYLKDGTFKELYQFSTKQILAKSFDAMSNVECLRDAAKALINNKLID